MTDRRTPPRFDFIEIALFVAIALLAAITVLFFSVGARGQPLHLDPAERAYRSSVAVQQPMRLDRYRRSMVTRQHRKPIRRSDRKPIAQIQRDPESAVKPPAVHQVRLVRSVPALFPMAGIWLANEAFSYHVTPIEPHPAERVAAAFFDMERLDQPAGPVVEKSYVPIVIGIIMFTWLVRMVVASPRQNHVISTRLVPPARLTAAPMMQVV